jgi:signal-transduction protein with cAMP-binding, CBS, and nucleotidyltransferase domain
VVDADRLRDVLNEEDQPCDAGQRKHHGAGNCSNRSKGLREEAGLISERDIVHAISEHGDRALSMPVREVAPRTIITVEPADTLKRAMSLMTHHRVRHLLVTAEGKFVGIISIGDAVKYRLEDLETESNVLRDAYISAH